MPPLGSMWCGRTRTRAARRRALARSPGQRAPNLAREMSRHSVQHRLWSASSRKAELVKPRSGVAVVAAVLALLLAGCSGPDGTAGEGDAEPEPVPGGLHLAASVPPSTTETETETDAPPTVAPASGASLQVDGVRLRAPLAFSSVPDKFRFRQAAFVPFTNTSVSVFRFPNLADFTVDELADATLEDHGGFTRGRRLDDEVIDDQPVYHLAGAIERREDTRDLRHRPGGQASSASPSSSPCRRADRLPRRRDRRRPGDRRLRGAGR